MIIERDQLIKKIHKDLEKKTAASLAADMGIPAMTLGRIVREKSQGSIGTWETIAIHYRKKRSA